MCVYLRTKFQVSSIVLTSFKWGRDGGDHFWPPPPPPPPHTHTLQNKPLKSLPKLGLNDCDQWPTPFKKNSGTTKFLWYYKSLLSYIYTLSYVLTNLKQGGLGYMIMPSTISIKVSPWAQDMNWMYIRCSSEHLMYVQFTSCAQGLLDVFWTSYVYSIYILCPGVKKN